MAVSYTHLDVYKRQGVILSQLFRGFTKVIAEYDELNVQIISDAFQKATETAYKAVMKPKEGTILTVAKGMSDKAAELGEETDDLAYFCEEIIKEGDHVLLSLIHILIYLVTEDISMLIFYAAQAVLLAMIQTCYQLFYSLSLIHIFCVKSERSLHDRGYPKACRERYFLV